MGMGRELNATQKICQQALRTFLWGARVWVSLCIYPSLCVCVSLSSLCIDGKGSSWLPASPPPLLSLEPHALSSTRWTPTVQFSCIPHTVKVKVKVQVLKVQVLSLDPKLVLTTSQFYLAGHWKWPHSYILSFTGSEFSTPQGLHFLSAPH